MNINNLVQYGDKMFKTDDDKPYTGKVFDLYKSTGEKKLEGFFRDGKKEGKWTYYRKDGTKEKEGILKDGKEVGKWTYWYADGQKWKEGTF